MKVLLAHPGTQHAPRLAAELYKHELLDSYHAGWVLPFDPANPVLNLLRGLPKIRRILDSRSIQGVPPGKIYNHPTGEWAALMLLRMGIPSEDVMFSRNRRFQQSIPDSVILRADRVIGFDTSSWILAERSKALGRVFLLDRSIGPPHSLAQTLSQAASIHPEWESARPPVCESLVQAQSEENRTADHIVVGCSYVKRCLENEGCRSDKISVLTYGVDTDLFKPGPNTTPKTNIRFLFAGSISLRKGIPVLLDAWKKLAPKDNSHELWLLGPIESHAASLIPSLPGLKIIPPLPRSAMPSIMQQCDVFVFPSWFEGMGLVILEAMACGLPVISTLATGGPDLYPNGTSGYHVEAGDSTALAASMQQFLDNPKLIEDMGHDAQTRAMSHTWSDYGKKWAQLLASQSTC